MHSSAPTDIQIADFHPHEATDQQADAVARLRLAWRGENTPGDPQPSAQHLVREMRAPLSAGSYVRWALVSRGGEPIGYGTWDVDTDSNPRQIWFDAYLLPAHRRQGIGRALVHALHDSAQAIQQPTHTMFLVNVNIPIGQALLKVVEGEWGLKAQIVERKSRLVLADVDQAAMAAELDARLPRQSERFRLDFFPNGELPEHISMADFVKMVEDIDHLMPLEDLTLEPERFEETHFHSMVARQAARGHLMWWYVVSDRATGAPVGYTLVNINPEDPREIYQWGTGVVKDAQGNSLGKILKLVMLRKIFAEWPQALFIVTNNAASNAAMIGINTALGFQEHFRQHCYQVEIDRFLNLLDGGVDANPTSSAMTKGS